MHEMSLMSDLMRRIETVARANGGRVIRVRIALGALCNCSLDHFREHFEQAAVGTPAAGAELDVRLCHDPADPHALEVRLESVEVAEPEPAS